ncbi:MAG: DUF2804 domain-containing protein [Nocardioidaceae bacterium]
MATHEPEVRAPVDLCDERGRLTPEAVGWSRRPVHRTAIAGWGRRKRWEYWGVVTPTHVVGLTVSSLDYAGVHGLYVLDRSTGREWVSDAVVPLARGVVLPGRVGVGRAHGSGGGLSIDVEHSAETTRLRASAPGVSVDLAVDEVPGREALCVVVPWRPRRFQYTVKDVGRPVSGRLVVDGTSYDVAASGSFAVLDHGRGKWPYAVTWNWAAAAGPGRALTLGGRWTDGTGMTENGLLVDGRLHKIGEELRWHYDRSDWLAPWRISGERVDVTLTPFHERAARTQLGVVANETHQCFGTVTGWALDDDGERVDLDGLVGWAEEARNRW